MMREVISEILTDTEEVLCESVCKETFLWSQTDWIPAYRKNKDIFEKHIVFVAQLCFFLNLPCSCRPKSLKMPCRWNNQPQRGEKDREPEWADFLAGRLAPSILGLANTELTRSWARSYTYNPRLMWWGTLMFSCSYFSLLGGKNALIVDNRVLQKVASV